MQKLSKGEVKRMIEVLKYALTCVKDGWGAGLIAGASLLTAGLGAAPRRAGALIPRAFVPT